MTPRKAILAIDPGGTTGWFVYTDDGVYHDQYGVEAVLARISDANPSAILVEHYAPVRTGNAEPAEIIGAARMRAAQLSVPFCRYTPAQAKSLAPNRLLARLGWHDPARPHASDAARLVVCYALLDAPKDLPIVAQVRAAAMAGKAAA